MGRECDADGSEPGPDSIGIAPVHVRNGLAVRGAAQRTGIGVRARTGLTQPGSLRERRRGHSIFSQKQNVLFLLSEDHQGAALTAHTYHTRRREMGLVAVTPNILILCLIKLFYRAILSRYLPLIKAFAHS